MPRIGVAVSGGADSVFLLHRLQEQGSAAAVLHVNHKLRGAASDLDEAFVRDLANSFALPVYVRAAPVVAGNVEQEARRLRYQFFDECIRQGICDTVATGHTMDDQAETVFTRFLRGSGTAGLSGILPVTASGIVRPLLGFRREEIRSELARRGIAWREDSSNGDVRFLRNRVRADVLPLMQELNPALTPALAALAGWARDEEAYWSQELDRIENPYLERRDEIILIRTEPFLELPQAVQRRLLRRGLERVRGHLHGIAFRHIEAMLALMNSSVGSGRMQLPDLDVYRSFEWLRLAPVGYDSRLERNFEMPLTVPGLTRMPERRLTLETELVKLSHVYNKHVEALDGGLSTASLKLRNWQPGDRYEPAGRSGAVKIKTLFQEQRIPLWDRRGWPVVEMDDAIVWTRRFGPASEFAARPNAEKALVIREVTESKDAGRASISLVNSEMQRAGRNGAEVS